MMQGGFAGPRTPGPGPGDPASIDPHDLRGPPVSRRVLHNRGLTVVTAPADTDCTIRPENRGAGLAHGRPRRRGTDRPRLSPGHRFRYAGARDGEALASKKLGQPACSRTPLAERK
jgi:hypothetical protein